MNAMASYLWGVRYADDLRYILSKDEDEYEEG